MKEDMFDTSNVRNYKKYLEKDILISWLQEMPCLVFSLQYVKRVANTICIGNICG